MAEPLDIDYLKPFIEATSASAARFRRVLIVMIIASVLAFSAFWNARRGSWLNSRIDIARGAEEYIALKDTLIQNEKDLADPNKPEEQKKKLTEDRQNLIKNIDNRKFDNAKEWLGYRGMQNKEQLGPIAQKLEAARVDNVLLIKIPFFGAVLDINDLGLLGGFTFVVILMWFRFSLWREYFNLRSTFNEANKNLEHLVFSYKSLAMQQVLTVPPTLSKSQPHERPWGKVVRLLYFLPVTVQLAILIYDGISFEVGWIVNKFNTVFGISMGLCFLALSGLLTYWCLRLSSEIDKEWSDTAAHIRKNLTQKAEAKNSPESAPNNSFNPTP